MQHQQQDLVVAVEVMIVELVDLLEVEELVVAVLEEALVELPELQEQSILAVAEAQPISLQHTETEDLVDQGL
jgi:hypothetical protein